MKIAVVALALALASCITGSEEKFRTNLDSAIGLSEDQVIQQIGLPQSTYVVGNKKYLQYEDRKITGNEYGISTHSCQLTLTIEGGHLTHWSSRGDMCRA